MSDLYILAVDLPGILDGTPMRGEYRVQGDATWYPAIVELPTEVRTVYGVRCVHEIRISLALPEVRDRAARWLAKRLGLAVGMTAPQFRRTTGALGGYVLVCGPHAREAFEFAAIQPHPPRGLLPRTMVEFVPSLTTIPLDHPHHDLLALAVVCRWAGGLHA